ncbi:hypothetical protein BGW80DRAFT_497373 [Lactifluus volemus]|nr:hypothetical protein BGW80DRAFT_497373 [Lactifluus volemus]
MLSRCDAWAVPNYVVDLMLKFIPLGPISNHLGSACRTVSSSPHTEYGSYPNLLSYSRHHKTQHTFYPPLGLYENPLIYTPIVFGAPVCTPNKPAFMKQPDEKKSLSEGSALGNGPIFLSHDHHCPHYTGQGKLLCWMQQLNSLLSPRGLGVVTVFFIIRRATRRDKGSRHGLDPRSSL